MRSSLLLGLVLASGCYKQVVYEPMPYDPEPMAVQGPPGGSMDQGYGYQDPAAYGAQGPGSSTGGDPTPVDENLTGTVTDAEIQTTLSAHGEWVQTADYGLVWRPYDTVVGADFTPYESCGSWVYTEYGWSWEACAEWSWGWLPFHYGQWAYYDDSWCWVAGYDYSPAWVDWRYGDGYVGWRPSDPRPSTGGGRFRDHRDGIANGGSAPGGNTGGGRFRDHRDGIANGGTAPGGNSGNSGNGGNGGNGASGRPAVRDHRRNQTDWTWVREQNLPAKGVRDFVVRNPSLRGDAVAAVSRPPVKPRAHVPAASLMRPRIQSRIDVLSSSASNVGGGGGAVRPQGVARPGTNATRPQVGGPSTYTPTTRPGANGGVYQPGRPGPSRQPTYSSGRPAYQPPASSAQPGRPTYQPPARPTYQPPARPTYQPPARPTYQPPARPTYSPPSAPSRPTYSPPSRSSSSSSGGSYSAPSRSSGSSSSGSSRSSGGSFGGGRRK